MLQATKDPTMPLPRPLPLLALLLLPGLASAQGSLMPCPETLDAAGAFPLGDCACWGPLPGPVWGSGPYTSDSAICAAALHAGVLTPAGGTLRVVTEPGRQSYEGSARNGITTLPHGPAARSFRVERRDGR